jgi:hypothetical protein
MECEKVEAPATRLLNDDASVAMLKSDSKSSGFSMTIAAVAEAPPDNPLIGAVWFVKELLLPLRRLVDASWRPPDSSSSLSNVMTSSI